LFSSVSVRTHNGKSRAMDENPGDKAGEDKAGILRRCGSLTAAGPQWGPMAMDKIKNRFYLQ